MDKQTHISLLIPCTSKGRDNWATMKDTYLYNYSLKTFLLTKNDQYKYTFYIGYDFDDRIFNKEEQQDIIHHFKKAFKNIDYQFISYDNSVKKGHVTKMWNILFKKAYDDDCDYFYQCGDDIKFTTKNWIKDSIEILKKHNDFGLSGPVNNNGRILTQAMVSRKHMEIFGWFFPEEIINWCCDDWYNIIYKPNLFFPLKNHYCSNEGGQPRYVINNNTKFTSNFQHNTNVLRNTTYKLAMKHQKQIIDYIKSHNET